MIVYFTKPNTYICSVLLHYYIFIHTSKEKSNLLMTIINLLRKSLYILNILFQIPKPRLIYLLSSSFYIFSISIQFVKINIHLHTLQRKLKVIKKNKLITKSYLLGSLKSNILSLRALSLP